MAGSIPAHVEIFYRVLDAKGKNGTTTQSFPIAVDIAVLQDYLRGMGQFIDAVIKGQIVAAGVSLTIDLATITGIKTAPLADSDREEGAEFAFTVAGGGLTGFRLPTFDEAFLVSGTNLVDTADAAIIALVDRVTEGHTLGIINVSPSNIYGSDIEALASATEAFQSS